MIVTESNFESLNVSCDNLIDKETFVIANVMQKGNKDFDMCDFYSHNNEENLNNQNFQSPKKDSFLLLKKEKGEEIPSKYYGPQSLLLLIVVVFVLIFYVLKESGHYLQGIFLKGNAIENEKRITTKDIIDNYVLYGVTLFVCSIAFCKAFSFYFDVEIDDDKAFVVIIIFWGAIFIFSLVKYLLYMIYGYIFRQGREMQRWHRLLITSLNIFGVFAAIPATLLIVLHHNHLILFCIIAALFVLSQIYLFWRVIVFFISKKYDFLYLIMYLCTVELIPYLFLVYGLLKLYHIEVI